MRLVVSQRATGIHCEFPSCDPEWTVAKLKEIVRGQMGVVGDLLIKGQELANDRTLLDLGLTDGAMLHIVARKSAVARGHVTISVRRPDNEGQAFEFQEICCDESVEMLQTMIYQKTGVPPKMQCLTFPGGKLEGAKPSAETLRDTGLEGEVWAKLEVSVVREMQRSAQDPVQIFILCPDRFECLGAVPPAMCVAEVKERLHRCGTVRPEELSLVAEGSEDVASDEEAVGDLSGHNAELLMRARYETPQQVISHIRWEYYADDGVSDDTGRTRKNLGKLQGCIDKLAKEINSSMEHFLYELVQNADDCEYHSDVLPRLLLVLGRDWLAVKNNERGFLQKHVRALCSINESTKKNNQNTTGEKGLGFKSVFKYTAEPHVASSGYVFKFTEGGEDHVLGYVVPHPVSTEVFHEYSPSETNLWLPARHCLGQEELLDAIIPQVLLFLRRLRRLTLSFDLPRRKEEITLARIDRSDVNIEIVKSTQSGDEREEFLVWGRTFPAPACDEERRKGCVETRVTLAFPCRGQHASCMGGSPDIFAKLPVRCYGLPFCVDADWLLAASREEIHRCSWNNELRDRVSEVFISAFDNLFAVDPVLRSEFFTFLSPSPTDTASLPGRHRALDNFFSEVPRRILGLLRDMECILGESGRFHRPQDIILLDTHGHCRAVATAEALYEHLGLEYISSDIDVELHSEVLMSLGCQRASVRLLAPCLGGCLGDQQAQMTLLAFLWQGVNEEFNGDLSKLAAVLGNRPVLPLLDGTMIPMSDVSSSHRCFFPSGDGMDHLLSKIGQHVLAFNPPSGDARTFLEQAGVQRVEHSRIIVEVLLPQYCSDLEFGRWHPLNWCEPEQYEATCFHIPYICQALMKVDRVVHDRVIKECRARLLCCVNWHINDSSRPDEEIDGFSRVRGSCLRSADLENILSCWASAWVPDRVQFVARLATDDETLVEFFRALGATKLFPLEECTEDFHHTLSAKYTFREFPIQMQLPKTYDKYTVSWHRFPASIEEFLSEFDINAPAEARLKLISLIAREWDKEYGQMLFFTVRTYHHDRRLCCHGRPSCSLLECSTSREYPADSAERLSTLPFIRTLRRLRIPVGQAGQLFALQDVYHQDNGLREIFEDTVPWFPGLDTELPASFLRACGVGMSASSEVLVKRLCQMSQQGLCDDGALEITGRICRRLQQLEKREQPLQTELRRLFADSRLVLCGPSGARQWMMLKQLRWDGPGGIFDDSLGLLSASYEKGLATFFVRVLGIASSPTPEDYIQALRWCNVRDMALKIYREISRRIELEPYTAELHYKAFREEALFWTERHGWKQAGALFVPDDDELLRQFQSGGDLPVLIGNRRQHLEMEHLLRFACAPFLSESVQMSLGSCSSSMDTQHTQAFQETSRLREVLQALARLMFARRPALFNRVTEEKWQQLLQASQVHILPSLTVTFSVRPAHGHGLLSTRPVRREVVAYGWQDDSMPMLLVDRSLALGSEQFFMQAAPEIARLLCKPQDWPELREFAYAMLLNQWQGAGALRRALDLVWRLPPPAGLLARLIDVASHVHETTPLVDDADAHGGSQPTKEAFDISDDADVHLESKSQVGSTMDGLQMGISNNQTACSSKWAVDHRSHEQQSEWCSSTWCGQTWDEKHWSQPVASTTASSPKRAAHLTTQHSNSHVQPAGEQAWQSQDMQQHGLLCPTEFCREILEEVERSLTVNPGMASFKTDVVDTFSVVKGRRGIATGVSQLREVLQRIYCEGGGPSIFSEDSCTSAQWERQTVAVRCLLFTHDRISETFSSGCHRGRPIMSLVEALRDGELGNPHLPNLTLHCVRFMGELYSLNNRRLWALKMHQDWHCRDSQVFVHIFVHDVDPVTAKFALAHSTHNGGVSVEVGEGSDVRPCAQDSGGDGSSHRSDGTSHGSSTAGIGEALVIENYTAEGGGYLSLQKGEVVVISHPVPVAGDRGCHHEQYVFGHLKMDDTAKGWFPAGLVRYINAG